MKPLDSFTTWRDLATRNIINGGLVMLEELMLVNEFVLVFDGAGRFFSC